MEGIRSVTCPPVLMTPCPFLVSHASFPSLQVPHLYVYDNGCGLPEILGRWKDTENSARHIVRTHRDQGLFIYFF